MQKFSGNPQLITQVIQVVNLARLFIFLVSISSDSNVPAVTTAIKYKP